MEVTVSQGPVYIEPKSWSHEVAWSGSYSSWIWDYSVFRTSAPSMQSGPVPETEASSMILENIYSTGTAKISFWLKWDRGTSTDDFFAIGFYTTSRVWQYRLLTVTATSDWTYHQVTVPSGTWVIEFYIVRHGSYPSRAWMSDLQVPVKSGEIRINHHQVGPVNVTVPADGEGDGILVTGYDPVIVAGSFASIPLASLEMTGINPGIGYGYNVDPAGITLSNFTPSYAWSIPDDQIRTANTVYVCVLTGAPDGLDDLEIPISSFQARMRDGNPSYIAAYIPDIETYAEDIQSRPNGEILIRKGYVMADGSRQLETIARVDYEYLRYDIGANSSTGVISGHRTESATVAKERAMSGVSYNALQDDGKRKIRCDVDLFLRPGDTATWDDGDSQMIVGQIVYIVNPSFAWMEVTEA